MQKYTFPRITPCFSLRILLLLMFFTLIGDRRIKNPQVLIGRTFLYDGLQIRRNSKPLSKTLFTLHRKGVSVCIRAACTGEELHQLFTTLHPLFTRKNLRHLRIENRRPKGKPNLRDFLQRPNRSSFRLKSVRNPWSKNALFTLRNPMNKKSSKRLRVYTIVVFSFIRTFAP